tara:strand:+ start:453 stop:695 length:243 start_codon:yes stop_codon:yes gene_type:complete
MNKKRNNKKTNNNFLGGNRESQMFNTEVIIFCSIICIFIFGSLIYGFYNRFLGPNSKETFVPLPGDSTESAINALFQKAK